MHCSLQQNCCRIDLLELKPKSASHSGADIQKPLVDHGVAGDADLRSTCCARLAFKSVD